MSVRRLTSLLLKLAALGLVVYALRTVDFRRLAERVGHSVASAVTTHPTGPPGADAETPSSVVGPCVNLNTADRADLERIVDIGGDRSREIMERRLVKPFSSLDDLMRVTGVGPGTIEDIRRQGLACAH